MDRALQGFLEAEAADYGNTMTYMPFMADVADIVAKHHGKITLTSFGNMGNISRQLILYGYHPDKGTLKDCTDLDVNFCPCGNNCWLIEGDKKTMLGQACMFSSAEDDSD